MQRMVKVGLSLLLVLVVFLLLEPWLTWPMKWATFTFALMILGFLVRRRSRQAHAILMSSAIIGDIGLVLLLQVQRGAVQTALSFHLKALQQAHIGFSTLATLLYFPLLYLGWALYTGRKNSPTAREWHKRLGICAFIFRSLGFLLMFSLLSKGANG